MNEVFAWHFLRLDRKLNYPPHTPVTCGSTVTAVGKLVLGCNGCHGSLRAIDALRYAPGAIVCWTKIEGEILTSDGKLCGRNRTAIAMEDATEVLHRFAVHCARKALEDERAAGREPHADCWAAIAAKLQWLEGTITDEQLSAARSSAESAAGSAAWSAARSSAESAAGSAAWSAARSSAESAAWSAGSAARSAGSAAWSAGSAAWSAAESAAESAQNSQLETALRSLLCLPELEVPNAS